MQTPPRLQGASRTTGGILRGHAYGNSENMADLLETDNQDQGKVLGHVNIYVSSENPAIIDPSSTRPSFSAVTPVVPRLGPILEDVAVTFSPLKNRNLRVFSLDNDAWVIQGRYNAAIQGGGDRAAWAFKDNKYNLVTLTHSQPSLQQEILLQHRQPLLIIHKLPQALTLLFGRSGLIFSRFQSMLPQTSSILLFFWPMRGTSSIAQPLIVLIE
ncbi:hypothetical protein K443DRAFT_115390 [Laccaria amethystina LaAM-08-1]|uniref:Uncharacterized protein n=1 Tax=Laccaria amethystina LaAM-08-1 TaxID=1095629 RepID=A0A0C9X3S1_9AGAR|nr:hypothetical protein K443DRAFT_115390 [Laccaria amethystina LaAM-08-1]